MRLPRHHQSLASSAVAAALLFFAIIAAVVPLCRATITAVETGKRFPSKQDDTYGKSLWKGYEYYARLQYVQGNMPLCPTTLSNENHTIIVPDDELPVALLVQGGGGCTLAEKIDYALTHILPQGIVRYLIVDGDDDGDAEQAKEPLVLLQSSSSSSQDGADAALYEITTLQQLSARVEESEFEADDGKMVRKRRDRHDEHKRVDVPLYIQHVSFRTEYELLDILLHASEELRAQGGPRITIDSRHGTGGFMGSDAAVWIALSAMISACACSFLMILGSTDFEPAPPSNRRPGRQRLTKEQVRNMLPVYRFDGETLHLIPQRIQPHRDSTANDNEEDVSSAEGNDDEVEGLVAATLTTEPPRCSDLELCSICLDEYQAGDKLRILPCHHAFHSRCVGKWLSERSAVCPLCKEDLFVEEDEDESGEEEGRAVASNDDAFWSRFYQQVVSTSQDDTTAVPREGITTPSVDVLAPPNQEAEEQPQEFPRASWWSRMFPTRHRPSLGSSVEATRLLTEPLLSSSEQQQEVDEEAPRAVAEQRRAQQEAPIECPPGTTTENEVTAAAAESSEVAAPTDPMPEPIESSRARQVSV